MNKNSKIYVSGHTGMVGSALVRKLKELGYTNLVFRTSKELDLTRQLDVEAFFKKEKPEYIFHAAAKVGGILANSSYPADFIYRNLMIEANVIHSAYENDVKKLVFIGSTSVYPREVEMPIVEESLLSGPLEKTNEPYGIAKIAGLKMCEAYNNQYNTKFITALPTNLYGRGDSYDEKHSHLVPALIRKFHEAKINNAKEVIVWGTGKVRREFLNVEDLAEACICIMKKYDKNGWLNIGCGEDLTVREIAEIIAKVIGFKGVIIQDTSMPDGFPRKLLDISKIKQLGWIPKISLEEGITTTYEDYQVNWKDYRR